MLSRAHLCLIGVIVPDRLHNLFMISFYILQRATHISEQAEKAIRISQPQKERIAGGSDNPVMKVTVILKFFLRCVK